MSWQTADIFLWPSKRKIWKHRRNFIARKWFFVGKMSKFSYKKSIMNTIKGFLYTVCAFELRTGYITVKYSLTKISFLTWPYNITFLLGPTSGCISTLNLHMQQVMRDPILALCYFYYSFISYANDR